MLSCNRIMEQSKLNQFCNDWGWGVGKFPLMAATPEPWEGNRGWSWGAETHHEHRWMVAGVCGQGAGQGRIFPGLPASPWQCANPWELMSLERNRESFGVEKELAWPGRAGRWRRVGGRPGGAGILAA